MMEAIISVIVPVYNGEKYIHECIDSILLQSFKNIELILVDDGSTDSSGSICDEYAAKDSRVIVIHKENEGVNATRRRGVMEAKGEWIAFSDADDSMPVDALDSLYSLHEGTDLVIGFPDKPLHKDILSLEECRSNAISAKLIPPAPWGKLYRRALMSEDIFDFPRDLLDEDMIMNIRFMFKINRAPHLLFEKVYNYRSNSVSVSHTKKASLQYEELYDAVRLDAIPVSEQPKYMNDILRSRITGLYAVAFAFPESFGGKNNSYLSRICDDVRNNEYKLSLADKILLQGNSVLLIKFVAFMTMLGRSVRCRLGLNN